MVPIVYLMLLVIPGVVRWKASNFLFTERYYGLFLLWLSRSLFTYFVLSAASYWVGGYTIYLAYTLLVYYLFQTIKEKKIYLYKKTAF